jgi:hypothetical protein
MNMKTLSPWVWFGCLSLLAAACQPQAAKPEQPNSPACEDNQGYTKDTSKQEMFSDEQTKSAAAPQAAEPVATQPVVAPQPVEQTVEKAAEPAAPAVPAEKAEVPVEQPSQPVVEAPKEAPSSAETVQN